MSTIPEPPEGLPAGPRVYPTLALPFGERVDDAHEDRGRVFSWLDVRLPRRDVPLDVDHDGEPVGFASSFTKTCRRSIAGAGRMAEVQLIDAGDHE